MDKVLLNNKDLLPNEVTLQHIQNAVDKGDLPLKNANVSQFVEAVNHTISDAFINYLINTCRAEKTAISYADKVKDVCEECGIDMMSLFFESKYSVDDLIYMYSSSGMMGVENRRQRYAPRTALKAFEDFVIYERDDQSISFKIAEKHIFLFCFAKQRILSLGLLIRRN